MTSQYIKVKRGGLGKKWEVEDVTQTSLSPTSNGKPI